MIAGKRFRLLRRILRQTGAYRIWLSFLAQVLITAAIIWLREPEITTYRKALWYCYAVVTTIGFGDVVAQSMLSRALSVLLSVSAALVIALITSVVVNYYNEVSAMRRQDTLSALIDSLERLPELSRDELEQLSKKVREFRDR